MRTVRTALLAALFVFPALGPALAGETAAPGDTAMMGRAMTPKKTTDRAPSDMSMSGPSTTESMSDDEAARKRKAMMMLGEKTKPDMTTGR